jgi:hypothetical protein
MKRREIFTLAVLLALVAPSTLLADNGHEPSTAPTLQFGVPYVGTWDPDTFNSWMRLPSNLHRKDKVQVAFANDGFFDAELCLSGPVDDFGADAAAEACDFSNNNLGFTEPGHKSRVIVPYDGPAGQPLLISHQCRGCNDPRGTFTIILEKATIWVTVGWRVPSKVSRQLRLTAFGRYGDNSLSSDGTPIVFSWRRPRAKTWRRLSIVNTKGGAATLVATLPKATKGEKIFLRACSRTGAGACADASPRIR